MLSNLYLNEVDRMLENAKERTRAGQYTYVEYVRWADDLVILVDSYRRHGWLLEAVKKRLREEFAKLHVEINEEKSRIVDLAKGGSFGFLGFDFRRVRSLRGAWRPQYTPKLSKRTALLRKLKEIFRRFRSQPCLGWWNSSIRFCEAGSTTLLSVIRAEASAMFETGWRRGSAGI